MSALRLGLGLGLAAMTIYGLIAGDDRRQGRDSSPDKPRQADPEDPARCPVTAHGVEDDRAIFTSIDFEPFTPWDSVVRATEWPYPVLWANVPFRDGQGSKVRPVVVHSFDDLGVNVSPMYSHGRNSDFRFYLQVDQQSARSFDRKGNRGYVAVTQVLHLPYSAVVDRHREPGVLSLYDRKRLSAALIEWEVQA